MQSTPRSVVMWLAALLLPVWLTGCNSKESEIVGTWSFTLYGEGIKMEGEDRFYDNGTGNGSFTMMSPDGQQAFFLGSFSWEVKGDKLHTEITSSNLPQLIPVGYTAVDTIVSLDRDRMVLDCDGEQEIYHRK